VCGTLGATGRCERHKAKPPSAYQRLKTTERGYDAIWRKCRLAHLVESPLCVVCGELANEVDHITPLSQGGDRFDPTNLQSMCKPCHRRKTLREEGRAGQISAM
jgi:5-methylcytosine-specific restriction enzyme A